MLICPEAPIHTPTVQLDITTVRANVPRIRLIRLFPTVFKGTHTETRLAVDTGADQIGQRRTPPASTPMADGRE